MLPPMHTERALHQADDLASLIAVVDEYYTMSHRAQLDLRVRKLLAHLRRCYDDSLVTSRIRLLASRALLFPASLGYGDARELAEVIGLKFLRAPT